MGVVGATARFAAFPVKVVGSAAGAAGNASTAIVRGTENATSGVVHAAANAGKGVIKGVKKVTNGVTAAAVKVLTKTGSHANAAIKGVMNGGRRDRTNRNRANRNRTKRNRNRTNRNRKNKA
jgi:hypothetical protein